MIKLVKESLNEVISFERRGDPLSTLGIGRKSQIEKWLEEMHIENYTINNDYSINVNGNVFLDHKNLKTFPEYIQFNKIINASFFCNINKLISLKGCPIYVDGLFSCSENQLTSLKGCPKYVDLGFYCYNNKKQFTIEEVRKYCIVKGEIDVSNI